YASSGILRSGWRDKRPAHVRSSEGVPGTMVSVFEPDQSGGWKRLRVGDGAESVPHARSGKDAENQFYMAAGSLSEYGKLQYSHDAPVASAATNRLGYNGAYPTQSIWRLAFQPEGRLCAWNRGDTDRPARQMAAEYDPARRREFGRRSSEKGNGSGRSDLSVGV